ncbi:MAG: hypothetical protein KQI35_12605 [Bacteroidetes bacterium]|nr:hypothetical protein [Bacteroidota bacterium]
MRRILHIVILCLIMTWGCNQITRVQYTDETDHQVEEERYGNGQLKSQTYLLNSQGTDYIYTSYYEDGTLMDSMVYKNNKLEGTRVYYDQAIGLKHIENFADGIMQGENKAIYNSGEISYAGFRHNGEKAGEWQFHYPDGRPITYEFYDSTGRLKYFRKYNESGSYQNSNGDVLIDAFLTHERIQVQDTVLLTLVTAVPPGCTTSIELSALYEAQDPVKLFSGTVENERTTVPMVFQQAGAPDLRIEVQVEDPKKVKTETSTKIIHVSVVK